MSQEVNKYNGLTELSRTIEALLFASNVPLTEYKLLSLSGTSSVEKIRQAIESLRKFYKNNRRSFQIVEIAGGYQITTLPEFSEVISRLFKSRRKMKLSRPALETLAIIAYRQPIARMEIEAIRGVNCDGVLTTLMDREIIAVTGRGKGVGRPYLYSTTKKFLEYLGLKDYRELPDINEIEKGLETMDLIPMPILRKAGMGTNEKVESKGEITSGEEGK